VFADVDGLWSDAPCPPGIEGPNGHLKFRGQSFRIEPFMGTTNGGRTAWCCHIAILPSSVTVSDHALPLLT
jgi:hypothetical protein